ncbi:PIR Superfamily Protein [Plasmodium ovale curtisi]|uniref:PIR Superfamily Protein n=1 Tax=Plasmodium ovale curtisi TaxID=864141 RepID=A0A1A8WFX1_PLAOA|nr:PIR Superfamily Protein [Plasmodium ovale curtisi]
MATTEPDYDLFEYSQDFFQNEDQIDENIAYDAQFCYIKKNDALDYNIQVSYLCNKFVKFFEKLRTQYFYDSTKYRKYLEYLNYWIAYKLRVIALPDSLNPKFYELLKNNYKEFAEGGELYNKIYQIEEKYFKNMDMIHTLYRKYYDLKANDDLVCQKFYDKYEEYYNLAVNRCYTTEEKLCKPLEKFVHFYKKNRPYKLHMCIRKGLPELPKFVTPKPSDKMNFIDKLSYHLYKLSSKQTTETLPIISNTKVLNLLSFNYNLLLYANDQKKRDNMMKILHEFIKFCKDENTISFLDSLIKKFFNSFYEKNKGSVPFLNLFIKEFFLDFYRKEKGEYELIYEECSINKSSSSYCTLYNECSQQLGKDLYKIKDNIEVHLKYKPTPAQELTQPLAREFTRPLARELTQPLAQSFDSQNLRNEVSLHIEENDNDSSHTTPINVGVGVGALFTLSFLYKFTPIGSWVNRKILGKGDNIYNYEEDYGQDFLDHNSDFDNYIPETARFNVAYNAA